MEEKKKTPIIKRKNIKRTIVIIFILLFALINYISLRASYLETIEIGEQYKDVFIQNVRYKYMIMLVNFIFLFITLYITNKIIKKGLKKFFDDDKKEMPKLPNKSIALILGAIISIITADLLTQKTMFIFNNTWFGIQDPVFNLDIAYFMFQKPFIEMILVYLMGITIGITIYIAVYYITVFNVFFDGVNRETLRKNTFIKQLTNNIFIFAVLLASLIYVKIQNIVYEKFITINTTLKTYLYGAGFTDITIKLWGYRLLVVIVIVSIFIAIKSFYKNNKKKMLISLAAVPVYLIGFSIIMLAFQLIFVKPNELDKEKTNISKNIEFTQNAYNINIEEVNVDYNGTITVDKMEKANDVTENIAILNENTTLESLTENQTNAGYYIYNSTSIDKYNINGKEELLYVSPREIVNNGNVTYNNKTYEYTHGFGAIFTSATKTDADGNILYLEKGFENTNSQITINQPRIYFGLETNSTIVTNAKNKKEYDYPIGTSKNAVNNYDGEAGISLNFIDRLILGIREKNISLAFSTSVNSDSKILTNRNVTERAKKILPNIIYDENPYLVVTDDGKLVWVLDGYTTSDEYPYSTKTILDEQTPKREINYIRNSVKVLIDAYDGTVDFYITDRSDPIIMAYRHMYPTLFKDLDENIPQDIAKHIKYPEYLYNIQASILETYHDVQPEVLYRSDDLWERATYTSGKNVSNVGTTMNPYYTTVKTIDSNKTSLGLVLPFTQYKKQSINAYLVGTYNNTNKLTLYKLSSDTSILGPMQLDAQLEQDTQISEEISALNVSGTKIVRDMIIVPIDDTLLYIEPIYQILLNENNIPILKKVVVASGNKVAIGDNLQSALTNLVSTYALDIEIENTDDIEDLIQAIIKANNNLEASNTSSDWEMIGKDIKKLQELIEKLEILRDEEEKKENNNQTNQITNNTTNNTNLNLLNNV